MAIGFLSSHHPFRLHGWMALALSLLALQALADDQIKKKDGTIITGQIISVSNGQVMVSSRTSTGGIAKLPYFISDIDSVTMPPPADVAKVKDAAPADVIKILEPLVKQFAGLPADWVVEAMAQLADAYSAQGQSDLALNTYNQIDMQYPNSKYHLQVVAGNAKMSLQKGKIDEALAALQPIVDQANKDIAPSQAEGVGVE
jgi:tetratricopeptide (TPR) repeat protein